MIETSKRDTFQYVKIVVWWQQWVYLKLGKFTTSNFSFKPRISLPKSVDKTISKSSNSSFVAGSTIFNSLPFQNKSAKTVPSIWIGIYTLSSKASFSLLFASQVLRISLFKFKFVISFSLSWVITLLIPMLWRCKYATECNNSTGFRYNGMYLKHDWETNL